jgi:hypothetical protein
MRTIANTLENGIMLKKRLAIAPSVTQADPIYHTITQWFARQSLNHAPQEVILSASSCSNYTVLGFIKERFEVGDGWQYDCYAEYDCDIFPTLRQYVDELPAQRTGALKFTFSHESGATFDVIMLTILLHDADISTIFRALAYVPTAYTAQWLAFDKECRRIENSAIQYRGKVYVVGGHDNSFDSSVYWDEIYLPQQIKTDIMDDIDAFFARGVEIYQRLNIKPFRKLLLAGVPGTGKTMLCSALANWALEKKMFVVYVSGSSNGYGARFWKIHQALEMAASSESQTLVIVEELDAYMQDEESKAELLNVLDGLESPTNKNGTVLVATTNHPEKIDDRVLKRPGRLDRIFIIPEMEDRDSTELMLRKYMGEKWRDEHSQVIEKLLGKPGAFIREVALYTLTMAAYRGEETITLELLTHSLDTLVQQIEAKDDFLTAHKKTEVGFSTLSPKRKRSGMLDY